MTTGEISELDMSLLEEYQLKKYQNLKKLKGVEFNERMKLEFALRDPKNIEACNYLTIIYNKKKKNNELINKQSFDELLREAKNINFFSVDISDIGFYEHELISDDLKEIFKYLIKQNIDNENNSEDKKEKDEVNRRIGNSLRKINDNLTEEIYNWYEYNLYVNEDIEEFDIKKSYYDNSEEFYTEHKYMPENLEKKIEKDPEKYHKNTNIKLKSNNIFDNNINLEINLAMPENELVEYITKLSKLYKKGKITKKIVEKETFESVFSVVGIKYLTEAEEFLKLLFIYDMHHSTKIKEINNNQPKLFEAISKKVKLSTDRIKDLSGNFKKTLDEGLYLQL